MFVLNFQTFFSGLLLLLFAGISFYRLIDCNCLCLFYYYFIILFLLVPQLLPKMQVHEGAIKFIIRGADCMCPGLTHPHAEMADVSEGDIVVCY